MNKLKNPTKAIKHPPEAPKYEAEASA